MTIEGLAPHPPLQQVGIGVVAPYDFALDRELWRLAPNDVSLYVTRLRYAPLPVTVDMAVHISEPEHVVAGAANVLAVSPLVAAHCGFGWSDWVNIAGPGRRLVRQFSSCQGLTLPLRYARCTAPGAWRNCHRRQNG
jgi:hypothetical protein